ncbi:UDP-N-acetylmuramate--L-alanine ligase [Fluviicola taffensis]|uniref:UDP-N-acetylmuramate--L-alanine ligase n=1 Tax=Fluviicola taffensis (strain DSM 16823 / NCIMB 13979 / RW262) TaxID=755732 RepID=F2IAP7_FLUTR|nr:UDP-N-acetylmuramate--L-alanine ligase [Fluviicola taffensis]AEA44202.1 UDP-N-acetylmuramate--L-alanine ligase [Fluviicola taffensis DSM 16823]
MGAIKMELDNIKRFYFIGIGGIGMSALARYFKAKGFDVAGYDKTPSPLTDELQKEGIPVHFDDLGENIPSEYRTIESTLAVYTPAIPKNMGELVYVEKRHKVLKRSEVLGLITQTSKGLGVAGTHGKTTTSTMLAYVLSQSHLKCSAFLGGISSNFNSNVLVDASADYSVIEADEFDRSFLRLKPYASIITAMDPDHLDIYGTEELFQEGFQEYANKHSDNQLLIYKYNLPLKQTGFRGISYGINTPSAQVNGSNLHYEDGKFILDIQFQDELWESVSLGLPGIHNAENALAVAMMCRELGLSEEEIRSGLKNFKGVKRRFEYHLRTEKLIYIDDYAHHPTEIAALVSSIRLLYPDKKIIGVFQPHLFSRTRDFEDGFVVELSKLDQAIIMPIYPAREEPIEGVTSDELVRKIGKKASLKTPKEVLEFMSSVDEGVVLTIGAGDIDRIVPEVGKILENK